MIEDARPRGVTKRELWVERLGMVDYAQALDYQRRVARARISGEVAEDVLLLVEHPPVVTLGRSAKHQHLLASPELLAARGVELFEVERGGDVTFHGPGQLVGYPIIDLKQHKQDLHWYLRQVEAVLIDALGEFGIDAERRPGLTGVWTEGRKIASIGVHARDWVTWHGFALNVSTDLSYFELMVPCGIDAVKMTSVTAELNYHPQPTDHDSERRAEPVGATNRALNLLENVATRVTRCFAQAFDLTVVHTPGLCRAIAPVSSRMG